MVDYCISRYKHKQEQKQYHVYVTDVLMTIANNVCNIAGGKKIKTRYQDLGKPQDTRTGNEIAADVMKRAGLTFGG